MLWLLMFTFALLMHSPPPVEKQGYSVDEACYATGIRRTKIYDLIKEGRMRVVKIGARTIIPKSEIDRLLNGTDDTHAA
jgi:excisionase family DNA binding protein